MRRRISFSTPRSRLRRRALVAAFSVTAWAGLGLAVQSRGVVSSASDCAERATCPDLASGATSDSSVVAAEASGPESGALADQDATTGDVAEGGSDGPGVDGDGEAGDVAAETGPEAGAVVEAGEAAAISVTTDCIDSGPEICTNDIDDNCNGLVDCADPQCSAYGCAAPAPAGWIGPALLWTGAFGALAPSCPPGYLDAVDANAGPTGTPDTCTCQCLPSGQPVCTPSGTFFPGGQCNSLSNLPCRTVTPAPDGTCTAATTVNPCGSAGSFTAPTGAPTGVICAPQVITAPGSAASWTTAARVCCWGGAIDPGGCTTAGAQCLLGPPAGFAPTFCIYRSGTPSCPASYPNGNVFYSGETNSRACGLCTCGAAPTGGTCAGTITLYGDATGGCTGPSATFTLGQEACAGAPAGTVGLTYTGLLNNPGFAQANYVVTAGTCSVVDAPVPTGAVTATGPTTVCCM